MNKKKIIASVTQSAQKYRENLENKKIIVSTIFLKSLYKNFFFDIIPITQS